MDTNKVFIDTIPEIINQQEQTSNAEPDSLNIFIMGLFGVFLFVVLYMLIVKIATVITKKQNRYKNED